MADEEQKVEGAEEEKAPKKKGPLLLVGVIGVLMLLEAVGVYALVTITSPKASMAGMEMSDEADDADRLVELLLVEDKFINISTGRVWQWSATIYLKLKNKNLERVQSEMEKRDAEIKEGISEIIASASDRHLREPSKETVKRQITAFVQEIFGTDAEGEPRIERIVISHWLPSPLDF